MEDDGGIGEEDISNFANLMSAIHVYGYGLLMSSTNPRD